MTVKLIKTRQDYQSAMQELGELIKIDPKPDTAEFAKFELLIALIASYEKETLQECPPDPIEAIKFRMDQQGLSNEDMIVYFGSRSKVSEVLNRKRKLTLPMIKRLETGLGVPAKVLISQEVDSNSGPKVMIDKSIIKEIISRGYITIVEKVSPEKVYSDIQNFISTNLGQNYAVRFKKTNFINTSRPASEIATLVWMSRVVSKAKENGSPSHIFNHKKIDSEFLRRVVDLSDEKDGMKKAVTLVEEYGIQVVFEESMPKTYIDGASIMIENLNPIVGLTLRHNRIDNFWFTLIHELSHIMLHYKSDESIAFLDDIDEQNLTIKEETEANEHARNIIIPQNVWNESDVVILANEDTVEDLAKELSIHPALVAGRARYEMKNYSILSDMVGEGEVKF